MKNKLDISLWVGKTARLVSSINKEIERLHDLPSILVLTDEQYTYLMKTPHMTGHWKYFKPEERLYVTDYNAMEIEIV